MRREIHVPRSTWRPLPRDTRFDLGASAALFLVLGSILGCNGSNSSTEATAPPSARFRGEGALRIVATVGMVADIVREVGGPHVEVTQICGPGVDPHLYKAARDDVQTIMTSDLVFYSGLMLEGKMTDTLVRMARRKPVVAVTENLEPSQLLEPPEFAGHFDPHVWMDVSAWSSCVATVATVLGEFDPSRAADYQARCDAYRNRLADLHAYGLRSLATIPESRRVLITSHDAFNYFGRAYGLEVQGIQGLSTESEAGLQRINELVDLLVERDIHAVFIESSVPRKNIDALVEGVRSRGGQIAVGGELYSDAMGEAGSYEGTYIGMLDHNITLVTRALGGDAPEGGSLGSLERRASGEFR